MAILSQTVNYCLRGIIFRGDFIPKVQNASLGIILSWDFIPNCKKTSSWDNFELRIYPKVPKNGAVG